MRRRMNVNIVIYVNNTILYLFIMQFVLQASGTSLDCTFDEDLCDWNQDDSDDFKWTRENEGTKSDDTGPRWDHTRGDWKGYYIYTEASYSRQNGDKARLISPIQEPGPRCLVFWYNMYGEDIGTLNVYMVPNYTFIFTKSGNIGDRHWRKEAISYNAPAKYWIVLEGIRGQDSKGDIAVDDISLTSGICSIDCTFDSGLCHWKQDDDDDFDWTWNKGNTPSWSTGPPSDHTSGHLFHNLRMCYEFWSLNENRSQGTRLDAFFPICNKGYYLYIDSSEAGKNESARIISPLQNSGKYCFSFWYYMYGDNVDTIRIFIVNEQKETDELVKLSGNQGAKWIEKNVLINSSTYFRITFEGKVSKTYKYYGDIAVDDIDMFSCPVSVCFAFDLPRSVCLTTFSSYSIRFTTSTLSLDILLDGWFVEGSADCSNPVPEHGKANTTHFQYDSRVVISCNTGYRLQGNETIVCQKGGIWSSSPTCEPVECGNPTPKNGKANSAQFYYSSMIEITCNVGYNISGRAVISCQTDGTWTDYPTCNLIDCGIWKIANGYFSAESGTTYGQTATQNCEVGYVLTGEALVTCVENGWNSSLASCNIVDCLAPTVANGIMSGATKLTTYNQTVDITCIGGYGLLGNATVTCKADGNWTSLPKCTTQDETSSALIAAYILVPVVVLAIALTFFVIVCRHKVVRCLTTLCANKGQDKNEQPRSGSLFTNVTYSGHHNDRQPNPDGEISEDSEYAIVTDNRNEKELAEHSIYYNTVDAVDTKHETIEQLYDHTKSSATPVFDSTYSHVSDVTGNFGSNYNTPPGPHPGKILFQTDEQTMNNSYDVLNIQHSKQGLEKTQQLNMQDDQESEYDHAKAGGTDAVDLDDYSHLQR